MRSCWFCEYPLKGKIKQFKSSAQSIYHISMYIAEKNIAMSVSCRANRHSHYDRPGCVIVVDLPLCFKIQQLQSSCLKSLLHSGVHCLGQITTRHSFLVVARINSNTQHSLFPKKLCLNVINSKFLSSDRATQRMRSFWFMTGTSPTIGLSTWFWHQKPRTESSM